MEEYKEIKEQMLPCPFCGGTDIRYSTKKGGDNFSKAHYYHCTCYCNTCRCYGPRALVKKDKINYYTREEEESKAEAIRLWNKRGKSEKCSVEEV